VERRPRHQLRIRLTGWEQTPRPLNAIAIHSDPAGRGAYLSAGRICTRPPFGDIRKGLMEALADAALADAMIARMAELTDAPTTGAGAARSWRFEAASGSRMVFSQVRGFRDMHMLTAKVQGAVAYRQEQ